MQSIFDAFIYTAPKVISVRVSDIDKELIVAKARLAASEASMGLDTQRKYIERSVLASKSLCHRVVVTT